MQSNNIKTISDADDDTPLSKDEKALLDQSNGHVLFFYLSGPMIFGVSKTIARHHNTIKDYKALVLDLSAVPMIDLTVGLALENAIKDAIDAKCYVYIYCPNGQAIDRLQKLRVPQLLPDDAFVDSRKEALEKALEKVKSEPTH